MFFWESDSISLLYRPLTVPSISLFTTSSQPKETKANIAKFPRGANDAPSVCIRAIYIRVSRLKGKLLNFFPKSKNSVGFLLEEKEEPEAELKD